MEVISSIIFGGISGAAVASLAGYILNILLSNKIDRSTRKLQHELDQEKQERRSQLEVISAAQKIRPVNYEQKNIEALESAYAAVLKTSLVRHNFRSRYTSEIFERSSEEKKNEIYNKLFRENYIAFSEAFNSVSNAFEMIEDKAIYIEPELESKINITLVNILDFYDKHHSVLNNEFNKYELDSDGNIMIKEKEVFDFKEFNYLMIKEWKKTTKDIRDELKNNIRLLLKNELSKNRRLL